MSKYIISVEFVTDKMLDQTERDALVAAVIAQIEEPPAKDIYSKRSEYSTTVRKFELNTGHFVTTYVNTDAPEEVDALS